MGEAQRPRHEASDDYYFSVAESRVGTDLVLVVSGEIDMSTGDAFQALLGHAVDANPRVVLDLRAVAFMDSNGLNAIVQCLRRAERTNGALLIRSPSRPVRRLFEATGVTRFLTFDTEPLPAQTHDRPG